MHRWKTLPAVMLAVMMLALSAGCAVPARKPVVTPTPTAAAVTEEALPRPEGLTENVPAVLYYPNAEGTQLIRQVAEIARGADTWMPQATVERLLQAAADPGLQSVFGGDASLTSISKSRNLITVDVRVNLRRLTEQEIFNSIMALVNTLAETEGVEYVSVLLNGQTMGRSGILVSPMTRQTQSLEVLWLMHRTALDPDSEPTATIQEKMTSPLVLFFKDVSGSYLLPEVQTQRTAAENPAVEVLHALLRGPGNSAQLSSVMRSYTLTPSPTIETAENGERYVNVKLASGMAEVQDSAALWMLCGAITLSLTYNIPDIHYVRISLDGQPLTTTPGGVFSEDGRFFRHQFTEDVGDLVELYFPNRNGSAMVSVMRAMRQEDSRLAEFRLTELLDGPRSSDSAGITYAFPLGVSDADLLEVYVSGYCVYVDLSRAFAEACRGMSAQEERMMIYSMVNSLTEIEDINQVQFMVEGKRIESLGGSLDLTAPLWRNPGIIQP